MKLEFEIYKVNLFLTNGRDLITIQTLHPSPYLLEYCKELLTIQFQATYNHGKKYIEDVLKIKDYETINCRNHLNQLTLNKKLIL